MVLASHVIFGMYGFWLPNDERGSWSDFVGSWELLRFGKATTVRVRESLARRPFDPAKRAATQQLLSENIHPLAAFQSAKRRPPKTFARGQWKVFLDSLADIERSIRYVEGNPLRENLPPQRWSFVRKIDIECSVTS